MLPLSIPSQADLNNTLLALNQTLQGVLSDDLGQYQLVKNNVVTATIPAIRVEPPMLDTQFRMAPKSGIECIISRAVDINSYAVPNLGVEIYQKYSIQLRQFNPELSTQLATLKIVTSEAFTVLDTPRTVPYTELSTGIAYESTLIKISYGGLYQRGVNYPNYPDKSTIMPSFSYYQKLIIPQDNTTDFLLANLSIMPAASEVFLNGLKATYPIDYTIRGLTLTWLGASLSTTDVLEIYYV